MRRRSQGALARSRVRPSSCGILAHRGRGSAALAVAGASHTRGRHVRERHHRQVRVARTLPSTTASSAYFAERSSVVAPNGPTGRVVVGAMSGDGKVSNALYAANQQTRCSVRRERLAGGGGLICKIEALGPGAAFLRMMGAGARVSQGRQQQQQQQTHRQN